MEVMRLVQLGQNVERIFEQVVELSVPQVAKKEEELDEAPQAFCTMLSVKLCFFSFSEEL